MPAVSLLVLVALVACSNTEPQQGAEGPEIFEISIEGRTLAGGDGVLRATQGRAVELHWLSDEATTLHLHGYDLELALEPGVPGVLRLEASAAGRFPITLHGFGRGVAEEAPETAPGDHDHERHTHAHAEQEPTVAVREPGEETLLYLEVHPR